MKIYGAGSLDEIRKCTALGVVGILTNPQGFDQYFEGKKTLDEITAEIADATDLPFFMQIQGPTTDALVEKARRLHAINERCGFKIIADEKGFWAIRELQQDGIDCIATTLFSVSQAAVAATVGAYGICPFVSRARAIGMDPYETLADIAEGYARLPNAPEIIAVSMKGTGDIDMAISAGVDAIGMRYPAIKEMMEHPMSRRAEALFAKNWANVKGEDVDWIGDVMRAEGIAE
jgi:transaldolase